MDNQAGKRDSFLLRVWREKGLGWRGWVQHIDSQESAYFKYLADLLAFIQSRTGELEGHLEGQKGKGIESEEVG
jgi:hypothetical protein